MLARKTQDRIGVMVEGESPELLWDPGVRLDREAPEVTFDRGFSAMRTVSALPPRSEERGHFERLFDLAPPLAATSLPAPTQLLDDKLEDESKARRRSRAHP